MTKLWSRLPVFCRFTVPACPTLAVRVAGWYLNVSDPTTLKLTPLAGVPAGLLQAARARLKANPPNARATADLLITLKRSFDSDIGPYCVNSITIGRFVLILLLHG